MTVSVKSTLLLTLAVEISSRAGVSVRVNACSSPRRSKAQFWALAERDAATRDRDITRDEVQSRRLPEGAPECAHTVQPYSPHGKIRCLTPQAEQMAAKQQSSVSTSHKKTSLAEPPQAQRWRDNIRRARVHISSIVETFWMSNFVKQC